MYGAAEVAAGFSPMRVARWIGTSGAAGVKHLALQTRRVIVRKQFTELLFVIKVNYSNAARL
jgi:hypothetical protein